MDVLRTGFKLAEWLLFVAKLRDVVKLIRWANIVYVPSHTDTSRVNCEVS